jgi:hypothetical protein
MHKIGVSLLLLFSFFFFALVIPVKFCAKIDMASFCHAYTWSTSNVKSAVSSLPSCWNCPHALYSPGFGKFAIKEIDRPPRQLASLVSTRWATSSSLPTSSTGRI